MSILLISLYPSTIIVYMYKHTPDNRILCLTDSQLADIRNYWNKTCISLHCKHAPYLWYGLPQNKNTDAYKKSSGYEMQTTRRDVSGHKTSKEGTQQGNCRQSQRSSYKNWQRLLMLGGQRKHHQLRLISQFGDKQHAKGNKNKFPIHINHPFIIITETAELLQHTAEYHWEQQGGRLSVRMESCRI